jgi:ribosomal protein L44E
MSPRDGWHTAGVPNRRLTDEERDLVLPLLNEVRGRLKALAGNDSDLHWALRRKLYKELMYDERSKPMQRRALKVFKRKEQGNKCGECHGELPETNVVLDHHEAMKGYTKENTRLLCRECDYRIQQERGFA